MFTWHTDNLENTSVALDFKKVADPCDIPCYDVELILTAN